MISEQKRNLAMSGERARVRAKARARVRVKARERRMLTLIAQLNDSNSC